MALLDTYARALVQTPARDDGRLGLHLADTLAAWIAGARSVEGREIAAATADAPALLGAGPLDQLVLAVAVTRLTEIDDIHMASCTTCGSIIVPTTLLMARMTGASAAQVSRALRDGYETMMRFGVALGGPSILYRGLWPTYLAAPLGAAAATSALLGLDETRTAQALALALLQVSGAAGGHAPGKASRWLLAGFAARAGATAALMVGRGYAADVSLLDGDWLQRTHGLAFDPAPFAEVAPILQETSLKPWCAAKQTIAAIDAFRQLLAQGVSAEQIQSVRVETPNAYRAMITGRPPGRLGRILNVGWQFGLAAYRPDGLLDLERAPHADDARVEALASKVEVVGSEALDALYPARWPAKVILKLADGSSVERMVTDALGDSAAMLDPAALLHKFTQVAGETCAAQLSVIAQQPVEAVDLAALDLMLSKALSA